MILQDDKRRCRTASVVIANGQGAANLPLNRGGAACQISFFDREQNVIVPIINHGYIIRDESNRVGRLEVAPNFGVVPLHGSETVLQVSGCENFLNRKVAARVEADGMFPNDYIRQCCRDAELPTSLWNRIPQGDAGYPRIAPTRPGRFPHSKPSLDATYLSAIKDTVASHCKGVEFWSDGLGLRFDKFVVRDRPELAFGTPATGVSADSHLCLRGEFRLTQDLSDFITSATCIGAKDPKTGQRFFQTEVIPQASDEQFLDSMYYVGFEMPYVADADESLRSDADCLLAARQFLHITPQTPDGLAPYFSEIEVDVMPEILAGDQLRVFGSKFIVDTVGFAALSSSSAGEDANKMKISIQLSEDRRPIS